MMMENHIETEMEHEIQAGFMQGSIEDLGNTPQNYDRIHILGQ